MFVPYFFGKIVRDTAPTGGASAEERTHALNRSALLFMLVISIGSAFTFLR